VDLDAVIARRRMHRRFLDRPVPTDVVDRLLDRARRAPSAGHTQGWDWLVLEGGEQTGRFWTLDADPAWLAAPDHPGLLRAPVIIVPLARREAYRERYAEADKQAGEPNRWDVPYWLVDTAFATMLLLLGATAEGLGALLFALHGDPTARRSVPSPSGGRTRRNGPAAAPVAADARSTSRSTVATGEADRTAYAADGTTSCGRISLIGPRTTASARWS
jgi:hypothetical protein